MIAIYALDSAFQLVTMDVPYINLQWTRRYYEAGQFTAEIPLSVYDDSWAYIGSPSRKELGMVEKRYSTENDTILISGFFIEKKLDWRACYPRYIGDVPRTETAVRNIFSRYKGDLPIKLGEPNNPLLGDRTQSDFTDDQLGEKIYSILESRECSYRIRYDYEGNQLFFEVWQGLDRTQSQAKNARQAFSFELGNILSRDIDFDESDYKNYAVIPVNADDDGNEQQTYYLDWTNGESKREIVINMRSSKPEEGQSMAEFKAAVLQEAVEKLMERQRIESVDIEVSEKGYMVDYDLGDRCDVLLTDVTVEMQTRIVEVYEVFKDEKHSITVGLGNKRISNLRRAVRQ